MSQETLRESLAAMRETNGGLTAPVPDSWKQGRTAFGGFSAALLLGSVLKSHDDLPPLRSVLINFVGPVDDAPVLSSKLLRRGRNVVSVQGRAEIDGMPSLTGEFVFGTSRDSHIEVPRPAPQAPPPDECEPFIPPIAMAMAPKFHRHIDLRLIEGERPMMGADRGYIRCWVRLTDKDSRDDPTALLCLADALPPAVFPLFKAMGPNSSVTWICNVLHENPTTEDGWWQIETDLTAGHGGYSSQVMRMWNSRGEIVVDGMQAVAVFV